MDDAAPPVVEAGPLLWEGLLAELVNRALIAFILGRSAGSHWQGPGSGYNPLGRSLSKSRDASSKQKHGRFSPKLWPLVLVPFWIS